MTVELGVLISIASLSIAAAGFMVIRKNEAKKQGALEQRVSDLEKRVDKMDLKTDKILEKLDIIVQELSQLVAEHKCMAGRDC